MAWPHFAPVWVKGWTLLMSLENLWQRKMHIKMKNCTESSQTVIAVRSINQPPAFKNHFYQALLLLVNLPVLSTNLPSSHLTLSLDWTDRLFETGLTVHALVNSICL